MDITQIPPQGVPLEEVDPLTEACGDFKTDFPCLQPERLLDFTLVKITRKVKDDNNKHTDMLNLKLRLEEDAQFSDGKPARKGFQFVQNVLISPSGEYDINSIKRILTIWNKAIFGTEKGKTMPFAAMRDNPEAFEGQLFEGRTAIKKDKTGLS